MIIRECELIKCGNPFELLTIMRIMCCDKESHNSGTDHNFLEGVWDGGGGGGGGGKVFQTIFLGFFLLLQKLILYNTLSSLSPPPIPGPS